MYKRIRIFDMDGVLVDSSHRYKLQTHNQQIDLQHWIKNEPLHIHDTLLETAKTYALHRLDPESFTIIATARDLTLHNQHDFIRDRLGNPNAIVSRLGRGDTRKGIVMKTEGILSALNEHGLNHVTDRVFYEDNRDNLLGVCENINAIPRYIESSQGF